MKKSLIIIAAVILLYFGSSLAIHAVYGDSYPFMPGENRWEPDGQGSWTAIGNPTTPEPEGASELVPLPMYYIPILLPGLFLFLVLFTPLGKKLDSLQTPIPPDEEKEDEPPFDEDDNEKPGL